MIPRAQLFELSIRLHEESFGQLLDALESSRTGLAERFKSTPKADNEYLEHLALEADDLNAWLVDMAELTIVAVYHWVERELKVMASWLPGQTLASAQRLDAPGLARAFRKADLELSKVTRHADVNVLRLFANSWKHNARHPSEQLLSAIRLRPKRFEHGLLSSERIERRLRKILVIAGTDATCLDIARATIDRAREFLLEVARTAHFRNAAGPSVKRRIARQAWPVSN